MGSWTDMKIDAHLALWPDWKIYLWCWNPGIWELSVLVSSITLTNVNLENQKGLLKLIYSNPSQASSTIPWIRGVLISIKKKKAPKCLETHKFLPGKPVPVKSSSISLNWNWPFSEFFSSVLVLPSDDREKDSDLSLYETVLQLYGQYTQCISSAILEFPCSRWNMPGFLSCFFPWYDLGFLTIVVNILWIYLLLLASL